MLAAQGHFGLSLDELEVEVISAGGGGFLGIGSKKAVIKAKPRGKSQADEVAELVAAMTDNSGGSLGLGKKKPEPKPEVKAKPAPPVKAPPKPPAPVKQEAKPRPKPEPRPEPKPPAPPRSEPQPPQPQAPAETKPVEAKPPEAAPAPPPRREPRPEREDEGPEVVSYAGEVLTRLATSLDSKAAVESARGEQGIELNIVGGEPGVLIGRRGQTLDALQYLTTRIVSHKYGRAVHLSVDAGGYRVRRRAALEDSARKAADRAKTTRKAQSLGPLSAQERRVVHLVLRSHKAISTMSRGKGEMKKVVITPR
ncbi:MAG: KH domain-containing protein [Desulfarculaceae bacterium]|nr:KH domain-containing protein [Desulfarculaceae bacterium]MCF8073629.1 KH domain-containing protein [Desulfarculaceae bacterium]MCF8103139.1 KH domain-containing protein [Desulfarculaceae bacterium]MCF8115655.1 KH domain-containing protein [Desulfarculaceae bacterium]